MKKEEDKINHRPCMQISIYMCIINTVKWCITFYHCFLSRHIMFISQSYIITTDRSISCLTDRDRPRPYWSSEILGGWMAGGWTWQSWWSDQWWTGCHVGSWSYTLKERAQNAYTETVHSKNNIHLKKARTKCVHWSWSYTV